jgi:signal transduction histidine kinase
VEYNSARLAKLNVPPGEALALLREFGELIEPALGGRFDPPREQLYLATSLVLNQAYYRVREAETQALFGIYRAEAEAGDLSELLERLVRILTPVLRARAGRIVTLPSDVRGKLSRPLYIERGEATEGLIADSSMRGRFASYWSYPLGGPVLAQFAFAVKYPWLPRELALLDAVAERIRAAGERSRLRAQNRQFEAQALRAEEEERKRIGRELHDETGQSLLLLRLQLELIERDLPSALRPRISEVRGIAEHAVVEIRRIVAALSPAVLERLGLEAAVHHLGTRFQKRCPARLKLSIRLGAKSIPLPVREAAYRVTQEALENVARHSSARNVKVLLKSTDKLLRLSVSDDGTGFTAAAAGKPMSFGLAGMQQRAALLGGTLAVKSAAGRGVRLNLTIPIDGSEGDRD